MAGPAAATGCITSYRRLLLTMSLAAAAALIVRGAPTEHRPSKTSIATAVAVVMRWKLSTAVAMSAAMTATTLEFYDLLSILPTYHINCCQKDHHQRTEMWNHTRNYQKKYSGIIFAASLIFLRHILSHRESYFLLLATHLYWQAR